MDTRKTRHYTLLTVLAKTLIVTEAALLSVLASVLTGFSSVFFYQTKSGEGVGMCACLPCA
jgi:hypothetical protein